MRWSKDGSRRFSQGYEWEGHFGGSEANVAVSLATLGNKVGYVRHDLVEWDGMDTF